MNARQILSDPILRNHLPRHLKNLRIVIRSFFTIALVFSLTAIQTYASDFSKETDFNLNVDLTVYNAICGQGGNGAVTTTVSGGVPPYTYLWSNGEITTGIVNLGPGTYSVTVTDAMGNMDSETATVIEESPINLQLNASYETCDGSCDGNVSVNASGGTPPYTYLWNTGDTFVVVDSACAGIYTVTVTDTNDCTKEGTIELELSPEGIWLMMSSTPVSCEGADDGTVHVSVMTGVGPYTYVWDSPLIGNSENGEDLPAGTYCVTVTDVNGCSNFMCVDVEDSMDPCPCDVSGTFSVSNAGCNSTDGAIDLSPSGGSGSYTFNWSNNATTEDLTDLAAGNYSVTITDANDPNCEAIIGPIMVDEDTCPCDLAVTSVVGDAGCGETNGSINLTVTGGTPGYIFIWSNGATTEDLSSLAPGSYTVTITDSGIPACDTIVGPITVGEDCCDITGDYTTIDAECGLANGSINLMPGGGSGIYTFLWSNGEVTEDLIDFAAGDYSVTITDANDPNCQLIVGPISITEDCCITPVIASVVVVESECMRANGSATITMAGNNDDFDFSWDPNIGTCNNATCNGRTDLPAGTYSVTITNNNDSLSVCDSLVEIFTIGNTDSPVTTIVSQTPATCNQPNGTVTMSPVNYDYVWCNGDTTNNPTTLMAGMCTVTVTDPATGCTDAVTVVIEEVNPLMLDIAVNNYPECGLANGSVSTIVTGGSTNYSYAWSNGSTTADQTGLSSGLYCLTVTDNGITGCVRDTCFILNNIVLGGATITVDGPISITCPGADDAISNYTVDYELDFMFPADTVIINISSGDSVSNENLAPGGYCIYITDANDCITGSACFTVLNVPQLDIDIAIDNTCETGPAIRIVALSGGNGGYTFAWSNGAVTQSIIDIDSGTYGVTVSDSLGCSAFADNLVVIDTCECPPILVQSIVVIDAECGIDNGTACIEMVDNNAIYNYTWTPDFGSPNMTGNCRTDLAVGVYEVEIELLNNPHFCPPVKVVVVVSGPPAGDVTVETSPDTCNAGLGTAILLPDDFLYEWSNGLGSGNMQSGLEAGDYYVTVTDPIDSCQGVKIVSIENINTLDIDIQVDNYPDCGQANGTVTVNPLNGTGPYSYLWNDGNTDMTRNDLAAGNYCVTVSDLSGTCVADTCFILVNDPGGAIITIDTVVGISCIGANNGAVEFSVDYITVDPATADTLIINTATGAEGENGNLGQGNYCIIILDADSCYVGISCFTILEPSQIDVHIAINNDCATGPSIEIVSTTGGTPGYTYDWEDIPGNNNPEDRPDLDGGSYYVTITDSNGCSAFSPELVVTDTCACPPLIISSVVVLEEECSLSDGRATVNIVGGGANGVTYTWSNGGTTATIDNLEAGYYAVTIADADRPLLCNIVEEITVGTTTGPESGFNSTPATCNADNGTVTFDNAAFDYEWFPDTGTVLNSFSRTDLPAGFYSVTITNPADTSCVDVKTVLVEEENADFDITVTINSNPGCNDTNGSATVEVSPAGNYSYSWGPTDTMDNISAGVYTVTVTDVVSGCTNTSTFVLSNAFIQANITIDGELNLKCPGDTDGLIDFEVAYNGDISVPTDTTIVDMTGNEMENGSLSAGSYCLIIRDANGCFINAECFLVKDPEQIDVDIAAFDENCDSLGSIVLVEVIGGAGGYIYNWNPPITNDSTAYAVEPGQYTISVTDANQCVVSDTIDVDEDPDQIDLEVIDITICADSLITLGDQIVLNNPSVADILVLDSNGDPVDIDLPISPDGDSEYTVTITSGACVTFDTLIVSIAPDINLNAEQDSTFCDESDAPAQLVVGCDNCDEDDIQWSYGGGVVGNGSVYPAIQGDPLVEGLYIATVVDTFGCVDTDTVTLELIIPPDSGFDDDLICKDDIAEITVSISAEVEDFTWEWEGPNITDTDLNMITASPSENSTYVATYTMIDHPFCVYTDTMNIEVIDLDYVEATADSSEICIYETSVLNVTEVPGGTYDWGPGNLFGSEVEVEPLETTIYTVTVTDINDCSVVRDVEVVVTRPACAPPYVFLPNAFTPNGDGKNDVLYLRGTDITDVTLIIYNRWGEEVFQTTSQSVGWDGRFRGKELGADVYGYYLTVRCGNGDEYKEKGNVTILK